ncbi:hypothetical protein [Nocardia sputi]|uniref:hypothetical protein n=1 Tax=Nocardia sputi TaxID=2943705 RepID=UPI0018962205|nr:hypothetical protein [Nocardia sputi]MBF6208731.1 hypothetical protein [Streptomyces gardneri]
MSTSVVVGCDSEDFFVIGSESPPELALKNPFEATGVHTGVNAYVSVSVDVLDQPPARFDEDAYATVLEDSLQVSAGKLRFVDPVGVEDDAAVAAPNGWLRLRIALKYDPYGDEVLDESLRHEQHVRLQCWPAEPAGYVLIKGWDPHAGLHIKPLDGA